MVNLTLTVLYASGLCDCSFGSRHTEFNVGLGKLNIVGTSSALSVMSDFSIFIDSFLISCKKLLKNESRAKENKNFL